MSEPDTGTRGASRLPRGGVEIQAALRAFVGRWANYAGSEISESQTFLNELIACYGIDRVAAGIVYEHTLPRVGRMDMFWPGRALVEMKAPDRSQRLEDAQPQAERYWRASADPMGNYGAVRYVVLCSFGRVLVWDMHRDPSRPAANLALDELPDHYEALLFLAGEGVDASFVEHYSQLTEEAAEIVARLYQSLKDRGGAPLDEIQRFTMQCVWTMFAEDLGMIADFPFTRILQRLARESEPNTARDLGFLFRVLNQKGNQNRTGELAGTRYVNGELFEQPAEVALDRTELALLSQAARYDWRRVDPTIFGSLMEGVLGRERRWELGAHYTHEADILKIVVPTIVRPWQERIGACASPGQARELLDELCAFRVLDPACGCGNFLYVAYRELRALEAALKARIRTLAAEQGLPVPPGPWPYVPLANMQGIDIERIAVLIARITLWMGHRQMIDRYGEAEPPLPLVALSGIRAGDALRIDWPETDAIIGNPPFLGAKHIRPNFGDEYADWLIDRFGVGVKDFCVYWFRRAQDHLGAGQRAGLVGTNSVSQTGGRAASLQYLLDGGSVITDAVSSQKWPGDAKVHVSLVNWVKQPPTPPPHARLDGVEVTAISTQLRPVATMHDEPRRLPANRDRAFAGVVPQGKGFILDDGEARSLLADASCDYSAVVRRFLTGDDLAAAPDQAPGRWIIDFGSMPLEGAMRFPKALEIVRTRVRPERDASKNRAVEKRWWLFGRRVEGMRDAVQALPRYVAAASTSKRLPMSWVPSVVCPNNAVCVLAFDDDFSMGVLQSRAHVAWAWARSSTLETRLRYTSVAVFDTFPWPDTATAQQREAVGAACLRLLARRSELCLAENVGLTKLYNAMDEGAYADLKALHRDLDEAVAACYGWPRAVAQHDAALVARLTELNRAISTGERGYHPFAYLGA